MAQGTRYHGKPIQHSTCMQSCTLTTRPSNFKPCAKAHANCWTYLMGHMWHSLLHHLLSIDCKNIRQARSPCPAMLCPATLTPSTPPGRKCSPACPQAYTGSLRSKAITTKHRAATGCDWPTCTPTDIVLHPDSHTMHSTQHFALGSTASTGIRGHVLEALHCPSCIMQGWTWVHVSKKAAY
jgi:hypothetical protein